MIDIIKDLLNLRPPLHIYVVFYGQQFRLKVKETKQLCHYGEKSQVVFCNQTKVVL